MRFARYRALSILKKNEGFLKALSQNTLLCVFHFYLTLTSPQVHRQSFPLPLKGSVPSREGRRKSLAKVTCNQPTIFSRKLLITKACVKGL